MFHLLLKGILICIALQELVDSLRCSGEETFGLGTEDDGHPRIIPPLFGEGLYVVCCSTNGVGKES
jgi:hypothetical protein